MTDGVVQVAPDATGKKVDTSELTRADGTTVVERQRVVIGSPAEPSQFANVTTAGELSVCVRLDEVTGQLKRIALLLEILTKTQVSISDVS